MLWATRVICAMSHLFPSEETAQADYWQNREQLLPHALVCITLSEQRGNDETLRITLMNYVAIYLFKGVRIMLKQSLSYCEQLSIGEQSTGF